MILAAQHIRQFQPLKPFCERTVAHGMTYGLGPAGYDVRVAETIHLPSGRFVLASTIEEFDMPKSLVGMVHDKSTWARRGLAVQNTVIEPGWKGFLTLELTNHGGTTIRIAAGTPIAQIVFHALSAETEQPYAGRYQNQPAGPQPALLAREGDR